MCQTVVAILAQYVATHYVFPSRCPSIHYIHTVKLTSIYTELDLCGGTVVNGKGILDLNILCVAKIINYFLFVF